MPTKEGASPQQGSLFGEILDWMLAPLLLIWPISVALTWLVAQGIASRPYDRELGEMARSLGLQVAAEAPPVKGKDRYALAEDWAAAASERSKALSWMEMKVDTVYGPQWTHPHPSFSASERWVVYTSDVTGHPQVYAAEIGDLQAQIRGN